MAGRLHTVALAVAGVINAADPAFEVSAEVSWWPYSDRAVADGPRLDVIPVEQESSHAARTVIAHQCVIAIEIRRPTSSELQITSDALLLEAIGDLLSSSAHRTIDTSVGEAQFVSVQLVAPIDGRWLIEQNEYRGRMLATYRVTASTAA